MNVAHQEEWMESLARMRRKPVQSPREARTRDVHDLARSVEDDLGEASEAILSMFSEKTFSYIQFDNPRFQNQNSISIFFHKSDVCIAIYRRII